MKTQHKVIAGAALLLVGILGFMLLRDANERGAGDSETAEPFTGVEGNPTDITVDFYKDWTRATNATDTDPVAAGLTAGDLIAPTLRTRLETALNDGADPVICQPVVPESVRTRTIYETEAEVQLMVLARDREIPGQTIITLEGQDERWRISDIYCGQGESAPQQGEFSFEQPGYLLKDSVEPPLDPSKWYLVYESGGIMGYTAVLNFNSDSTCVEADGTEVSCDAGFLTEAKHVLVAANMTESGAEVVRVTALE